MIRWSSPVQAIREHYDVVVVGSGYGGAIAASRLSRAGRSVCLLERGREIHPGEYPDQLLELAGEFQTTSELGHSGSRTALYDLRAHKDMSVFLGCGLGGTSLVNANVALKAEPRVFDSDAWPAALRGDLNAGVSEGYARATQMLRPNPLPAGIALNKLKALEVSSKALEASTGAPADGTFYRPPINVTFEDRVNDAGVAQHACSLCGDCVSGCNFGAKNTLLMNYLPDAFNHGAHIFTQVPVRSVQRSKDGWLVHFQILDNGREAFDAPEQFVAADLVVLAAGTLGSTEILLRSRARGLEVSAQLGTHFTGNGDVLGFSYDTDRQIDTIGWGHRRGDDLPRVGPCITGIIDLRQRPVLTDGMVIEEGSIPGGMHAVLPDAFAAAAEELGTGTGGLAHRIRAKVSDLVGSHQDAAARTQTYLVMAHDSGSGSMVLDGHDHLAVQWPEVASEPIFAKIRANLQTATEPLHGEFVENPLSSKLLDTLITVHPLGGCIMGEDAAGGVVNHQGQVFAGGSGTAVYEDLYVCDGSVIPCPLGVNPLFTISALTERACALMAAGRGWTIPYDLPSSPPPGTPADSASVGIRFTERMTGYFSANQPANYQDGYDAGAAEGSSFTFILTIASEDLDQLIADPTHPAQMIGTVQAPALSPAPLEVSNGAFNLFVVDPDRPETVQMHYAMTLTTQVGRSYFVKGFKEIHHDKGLDLWPDTSTLYITVFDGADDTAGVLGLGILRILPSDFLKQMRTMGALNAPSKEAGLLATARFGKLFAGALFDTYAGILVKETFFDPSAPPRRKRRLDAPAPEVHPVTTSDGVVIRLTRYPARTAGSSATGCATGSAGPVLLSHGLGRSSGIFSTDMIDPNLVEFLSAQGFDIWLLDHRGSIDLATCVDPFTADDLATRDYPAAIAAVLAATGVAAVPVVADGFGSLGLVMAVLAGVSGVASMVCFQVATHLDVPTGAGVRAGLHVPGALQNLGVQSLPTEARRGESWRSRLFDAALRATAPHGDEHCDSATCHRISLVYGLPYAHANLDEATHQNLEEIFGPTSIVALEHLSTMVRAGRVVTAAGEDAYLPHLERLAMPVTFICGSANASFLPGSTEASYDLLVRAHGPSNYARFVIAGYGDADCLVGSAAASTVYPKILEHLRAGVRS